MHQPDSGSVWDRQVGRDGMRLTQKRRYEVDIYNTTRFMDLGLLEEYFQQHILTKFDWDPMDSCRPESRTATVWRLSVHTAECPDFLRGIVRIVWYGRTLVLQHPNARQRLQCLHCGNLGHTMARCQYTESQLLGSGSRVALEQEVAKLVDRTKPFASLDEVTEIVNKRLEIQKDERKEAQAALAPARKLYAHAATFEQKLRVDRSRYDVLTEDDENEGDTDAESPATKPLPPAPIDIPSEGDLEEKAPVLISSADKAKLRLVQAKPPKPHSPPQLVALKSRERKVLRQAVSAARQPLGDRSPPATYSGEELRSFSEIEASLGIR
ncbi:hypothetical protein F443_07198 [Phytophthora nicotianae P1569]|uniref:Uncharacterized protein n=1 Tax=Phytophthora nicotianae P1569 TaxID=1317065 RepID=V9FEI4_PHYNI|nr:hypothetical protein F443_07198 [Phytophthora nicotianae P1569]